VQERSVQMLSKGLELGAHRARSRQTAQVQDYYSSSASVGAALCVGRRAMYLQNVYNLGSDIGGAGRRVDVITQHYSQHTLLSLNNMNEIDYIERLLLLSIHFACFPAALCINL
jgi:hypothetical protein